MQSFDGRYKKAFGASAYGSSSTSTSTDTGTHLAEADVESSCSCARKVDREDESSCSSICSCPCPPTYFPEWCSYLRSLLHSPNEEKRQLAPTQSQVHEEASAFTFSDQSSDLGQSQLASSDLAAGSSGCGYTYSLFCGDEKGSLL